MSDIPIPMAPDEGAAPDAPEAPRVTVRLPDGRIGDVPADQADSVAASGGAVMSAQDLAHADNEAKYGGTVGAVLAAPVGLARGLSLGLSDPLAIAAGDLIRPGGGEAVRQGLAGLKDVNPLLSGAGEIASFAVPVGAAEGVAKLGMAAERGIASLVGHTAASAGGRIAQKGLASLVSGATEGALYGAGDAISEDALGDHDLTAEKLFAGAGEGALFGGLLGGLAGSVGQTGVEGARVAKGGLDSVRAVAGPVGAQLGDVAMRAESYVEDAMRKGIQKIPGGDALLRGDFQRIGSDVRDYLDTTAGQLAARTNEPAVEKAINRVYKEGTLNAAAQDEALDTSTREVAKAAKPVLDSERTIYEIGLEQKGEHFAPLIDTTKGAQQKAAALDAWQTVRQFLDFWGDTATKGGAEGGLKKFGKVVKDFEDELGDAVSKQTLLKNPEKVMMLLDQLKRDSGHGAQFGRMPWERAEAAAGKNIPTFEGVYNKLRGVLEDEAVWGKAGLAQKEINAAHTVSLGTRDSFGKWFVEKYGSREGEPLFELDPGRVRSLLTDINGASADLKNRAFVDYGAGMNAKMDALEKWATLTPVQRAKFDAARAGIKTMQDAFAKARVEAEHIATVRKLRLGEGERGMLDMAAPLAGSLVAGPVGAVAGIAGNVALDAGSRPLTTAERLRSMRKATEQIDSLVAKAVNGVLGKQAAAAQKAVPRDVVDRAMKEIANLSANGQALMSRVGQAFGHVATAAPKVATSLGSTASRAVGFLALKSPKQPLEPASLTPQLAKPTPMSDTERATFARYLTATLDPRTVLDDMHRGRVTPEAVETLKVVYPKLYEQVRSNILTKLSERTSEVPYADRLTLWRLLDVPTDVTTTPDFMGAIQALRDQDAAAGAQAHGSKGAPRGGRVRQSSKSVASSYATQSQKLEG